jgi:hypothetical protein
MNTKYERVIPRDLFNESKLLKCMGRLILLIHDNLIPVEMMFKDNGKPFKIALMDEGALTIVNLRIFIKGQSFIFKTIYNSKANYPLYVERDYCDYLVFDEKGEFDKQFVDFCNSVQNEITA